MPNDRFRQDMIEKIKYAVSRSQSIDQEDHPGIKGEFREIIVSQLLDPILPANVSIGSGKIVDYVNNESAQTDIVLYDKSIIPPVLYDEKNGLFPLESCFYAVEVKSRLTAKTLRDAVENANRLRCLKPSSRGYSETYQITAEGVNDVRSVLFALESDLDGSLKDDIIRYKELDAASDTDPAVRAFCVVGKGYWWFYSYEMDGQKWIELPPTENFDEVIDFLGGIVNTIIGMKANKGFPRYGNYIIKPRQFSKR